MSKKKIALCDPDATYRERFAAYLTNHKPGEIIIHTFSEELLLLEQMEKETYELIILAEGYRHLAPGIWEKNIPVLILTDTMQDFVAEESAFVEEKAEHKPVCTSRFQSMESMVRKIYLMTASVEGRESRRFSASGLDVIGVCAPVHHEMQQLFSVLYAQQMAEEKKVLYLNFLEYSGFCELFGQYGEYDMGDLVLRLRNKNLTAEKFRLCVYEMRGVSIVLPFKNPENIREFRYKDLRNLLDYVAKETDYEVVVMDLGAGMEHPAKILAECQMTYCLMREGYFYRCQLEEFLDYARKAGEEEMEEKLQIVCLPYSAKRLRGGGNLIEQLNWSEFGDFVRNYRLGGKL